MLEHHPQLISVFQVLKKRWKTNIDIWIPTELNLWISSWFILLTVLLFFRNSLASRLKTFPLKLIVSCYLCRKIFKNTNFVKHLPSEASPGRTNPPSLVKREMLMQHYHHSTERKRKPTSYRFLSLPAALIGFSVHILPSHLL